MSPGSSTESYPAFARIGLRENPGKNLNQVTCPDRDSNPGHLVSQPDALTVTPQQLSEDDPDRRMQFCELMMERINNNPTFLRQIIFSDEATFCLTGFVNRHNCRYWSDINQQ
ncbi:hypothetical protein ANN_23074 [Periplaneta americana]|uniref:Uncharacterized protein n=1 Tax=Periplaneta americana TaxID=6978 RepID=A0ABQ8SLI1_PERAM|nr:hypothetical protein ANN_23074 [Periplaneta americana]